MLVLEKLQAVIRNLLCERYVQEVKILQFAQVVTDYVGNRLRGIGKLKLLQSLVIVYQHKFQAAFPNARAVTEIHDLQALKVSD